ncbi:sigma-70 family RNA polymerase sigma factor [Sorangium cellulosum]|nr:sigma-70 family RNA polymerase sigma factor [Sorangium cellulosum]
MPLEVRVPFGSIALDTQVIERMLDQFKVPRCDRPDVMQDILLSAWHTAEAGGFRPVQSHAEYVLARWLVVVACRHILRYKKRQLRWHNGRAAFRALPLPSHTSPLEQVDARWALRVLERLTPELRVVLAEAALGSTVTEIAADLGNNLHTTQKRLVRGRRRFREALRRWRVLRRPDGSEHGGAG